LFKEPTAFGERERKKSLVKIFGLQNIMCYSLKLLNLISRDDLHDKFQQAVLHCKKCALHRTRQTVVVGKGDPEAEIMLIGEAPGEQEDKCGLPFVGRAGKLLDKMLVHANINPENLYITNTVLCRPPNNRNPLFDEEIMACHNRLMCHILMVRPKIVVAMGRVALQALIGDPDMNEKMKDLVGKTDFNLKIDDWNVDIFVTYHPSYLLRQPSMKEVAEQHWVMVKQWDLKNS